MKLDGLDNFSIINWPKFPACLQFKMATNATLELLTMIKEYTPRHTPFLDKISHPYSFQQMLKMPATEGKQMICALGMSMIGEISTLQLALKLSTKNFRWGQV